MNTNDTVHTPLTLPVPVAIGAAPALPAASQEPPPPTPADVAERVQHDVDAALHQMELSQGGLDTFLAQGDKLARALDAARIPLDVLARGKAKDQAATWAQAQQRVADAVALAPALGANTALQIVRPALQQAQVLDYAQARLLGSKESKEATSATGERVARSASQLTPLFDEVELGGAKAIADLVQASSDTAAPMSDERLKSARQALDDAGNVLDVVIEHLDPLHMALYQVRHDGKAFRGVLDQVVDGTLPPPSPSTYARELDAIRSALRPLPHALREIDAGELLATGFARAVEKANRNATEALRLLRCSSPGEQTKRRTEALTALGDLRSAVSDMQGSLLGAGSRVIADAMADLWLQSEEPAQRLQTIVPELQKKDEENRFIFRSKYGSVARPMESDVHSAERALKLTDMAAKDAVALPRRFTELFRRIDDVRTWLVEAPDLLVDQGNDYRKTFASDSVVDGEMFRIHRLVQDLTAGFARPADAQKDSAPTTMLGNIAQWIEDGLPGIESAAAIAEKKKI